MQTSRQRRDIIGHTIEDTSDQKSRGSSLGFSKLQISFHMNWFCFVLTSVGHFLVHMSLNTQTGPACWNGKPYKEILQAWICWGLPQKETWVIYSLWGVNHRLLAVKNTLLLLHAYASDNTEILKHALEFNSKQFPTQWKVSNCFLAGKNIRRIYAIRT